jgi:hypothetical protein
MCPLRRIPTTWSNRESKETNEQNESMKTPLLLLACGLLSAGALIAADRETTTSTTTTKTTTSTGTLQEWEPGTTFVMKEASGPVKYRYGKKVTYVTKSGKEIPEAELKTRIRVGNPVSVEYGTEGDARIVNRVIIDD